MGGHFLESYWPAMYLHSEVGLVLKKRCGILSSAVTAALNPRENKEEQDE